ncbi:MAG TPA: DUF3011 domain-containing protein [Acidobacteriaceae bacterium]
MHVRGFLLTTLGMIAMFALAAPAAKAQTITCSSDNGQRNYCPANTKGADVRMVRQRSDARCTQGYSWGYDRHGIWVDRGCRADFIVTNRPERPGGGPGYGGPGYGGEQTITCSSDNGQRNYCPANTNGADVRMVRQRSDARCTQGYSWGYDRRGIWVDRGCRADFIVTNRPGRPGGGPGYGGPDYGGAQTITCSSDDGGRRFCGADTRNGVRLVRQRSDARCTQGYSWGYDRRGIWVDRGCRADFVTR